MLKSRKKSGSYKISCHSSFKCPQYPDPRCPAGGESSPLPSSMITVPSYAGMLAGRQYKKSNCLQIAEHARAASSLSQGKVQAGQLVPHGGGGAAFILWRILLWM